MKLDTKQLKNITILYVEDDQTVRLQTEKILDKLFKKVYVAIDGQNGLDTYSENMDDIDIVISDINMPNLNGLDMIKEINNLNKSIPTIVTTAHTDSTNLMRAIDINVDKYISKPVQIKELTIAIVDLVVKYKRVNNIENLAKNLVLKTTQNDKETNELNYVLEVTKYENEYLKTIVDNMVVSFKTDKNGLIREISNKFKSFFEYDESIFGEDMNILKCQTCTQESFQKLMLKAIHTKKTLVSTYTFQTKSDRRVDAEVTMTPHYGEDTLVNGYTFYLDLL